MAVCHTTRHSGRSPSPTSSSCSSPTWRLQPTKLPQLRQAAQQSPAGPCGLIAVNAAAHEFGAGPDEARRPSRTSGFQQALPQANAGLTLRVYFQQMFEGRTGKYIGASAALALCETACARTNDWSIAKAFIDARDRLESEFPELRDLATCERTSAATSPCRRRTRASCATRCRSRPRPASSTCAPMKPMWHRAQAGRSIDVSDWMTAMADGTIPPESADAARVVVATLRRLQDAEDV